MTTEDIIAALGDCDFAALAKIREALDARAEAIKTEFMAKAEAMGLACHDGNGKKTRKPRQPKLEQEE
jgi:cytochrome c553